MKKKFLLLLVASAGTLTLFAQPEVPTPQWRPVYHFTPEKNWTNDPNGLIFINGVYQLYNQQNPFENKWGHMSWGHASSADLVHWKRYPVAMPETIGKDTDMRFSGSVVKDINNTSGFCKTPGCLVAVYTLHQPNRKKQTQAIAYSNDGGMSFTQYSGNPVIDLNKEDFRDPSVTWSETLKKWLMVVVLPVEHKAQFYTSANLKEWNLLSEFGDAGYQKSNWECPSLLKLPVEGKPGEYKWVLFISAAGREVGMYMQYFIGEFDGKTFRNENSPETVLTVDNGDSYYAAIPWNDQPQNKAIMIGWIVPGKQETYPWRGQMSVPRDLTVRQTPAGYRLVQKPTSLIDGRLGTLSSGKPVKKSGVAIGRAPTAIATMPGNAWWLDATVTAEPGSDIALSIGEKKDGSGKILTQTLIGYDADSRSWYLDRSLASTAPEGRTDKVQRTVLEGTQGAMKLQILFDKSSLEIFTGDGEKVITAYIFPDADANGISVMAKKGSGTISTLTLWDLSRIKQ